MNDGKVNIRGKEYETVAHRVSRFRIDHGFEASILTYIVSPDDPVVVRAEIVKGDRTVAVGHAEEKRGASNINKTSALENCETSAIGRALANAGYLGTEYASADELAAALVQQRDQPRAMGPGNELNTVEDYLARIAGIKSVEEAQKWEEKHVGVVNEKFSQDAIDRIANALFAHKEKLQKRADEIRKRDPRKFGPILKAYRERLGIEPPDLAKEMGMRVETLKKVVTGQKVSASTLQKVADFVDRIGGGDA